MTGFRSNVARACAELHEIELRKFYDVWQKFRAAGVALPKTEDPAYVSADALGGHVFRAARGYLTWMGECVGRPVTDIDSDTDPVSLAGKTPAFLNEVLDGWQRHLCRYVDEELAPAQFTSRWGEPHTLEQMLEHAVVHPMRHRIQLERLMAAAGAPGK